MSNLYWSAEELPSSAMSNNERPGLSKEQWLYLQQMAVDPLVEKEFVDLALVPTEQPEIPDRLTTLRVQENYHVGTQGSRYGFLLRPRDRFLLNVLLVCKGSFIEYENLWYLEKLAMRSRNRHAYQRDPISWAIPRLRAKIGRDVIEADDDRARMTPETTVLDDRQHALGRGMESEWGRLLLADMKRQPIIEIQPAISPAQSEGDPPYVQFPNQRSRIEAVTAIINTYRDHPDVQAAIGRLRAEASSGRAATLTARAQYQYESQAYAKRRLPAEETGQLFSRMERGVIASRTEDGGTFEEAALIDTAIAAQTLYLQFSYFPLDIVYHTFSGYEHVRDDLIQVGNMALWESIMCFDYSRGTSFKGYARQAVTRTIWQHIYLQANREHQQLEGGGAYIHEPVDRAADRALEAVESQAGLPDMVRLMAESGLTTREQLVLSLYQRLYLPFLKGQTIPMGSVVVNYEQAFAAALNDPSFSHSDTARLGGLKAGAVRTLASRGMAKMREKLVDDPRYAKLT